MKLSIKEQIVLNIEETLKNVAPTDGYNFSYHVERWDRVESALRPFKLVIVEGKDRQDSLTTSSIGDGAHRYKRLPIALQVYLIQSETLERPYAQLINLVEADLEKAIFQDDSRGGLAHQTVLEEDDGGEPFEDVETGWAGLIYFFTVQYNHPANDPYERGGS
jgi:hypothetical protein